MNFRMIVFAVALALVSGIFGCRRGAAPSASGDPAVDEKPAATAEEASNRYLKAVAKKDFRAMAVVADVPWLDRDRRVVRDRDGLAPAIERAMAQAPEDLATYKVDPIPYKDLQRNIDNEAERKLLDDVMGENGMIVVLEKEGMLMAKRYLLIRVKDGKAAVVAGPLKENQLVPSNPIPATVERLLDQAESFELYSLDPDREYDKYGKVIPPKVGFHGWKVLGKAEVKEGAERKNLVDALRLGAEDNAGTVAGGFIPRHGIRLKAGMETVDLVICFECLSVQVYVNDKGVKGFLTTGDPQTAFDAALTAAGVKLPKQAGE